VLGTSSNFDLLKFSVCPNRQCVQPACAGNPCIEGKCIEICKNSCVAACEVL